MSMNTTPYKIDETKRLLITAGAAVAANGGELVKKTLAALTNADVPREKSALALSIGRCVRERPAHHMMSVADVLVETGYGVDSGFERSADAIQSDALCPKTVLLISAGAAMAANCEPCLNMLVPRLIEVGVSDDDIRTAVNIGKETLDSIVDTTWAAVSAAMGEGEPLEAVGCGCESAASHPAETTSACYERIPRNR